MQNQPIGFFTYFTAEFLELGIVSVKRFLNFQPESRGIVYTFDEETKNALRKVIPNSNVVIFNISSDRKLLRNYTQLLQDRNELEAIISLKPHLFMDAQIRLSEILMIIYFDPDVMFFSSLDCRSLEIKDFHVYKQMGVPQDSRELYGQFNAGIVIARDSENSRRILREWSKLCSAWCKLEVQSDRYADQKYLDELQNYPGFSSSASFTHNLSARAFSRKMKMLAISRVGNKVLIENQTLVSYHFHGLRVLEREILTGINRYGLLQKKYSLMCNIYLPVFYQILNEKNRTINCSSFSKNDKNLKYRARTRFHSWIQILRMTRLPWTLINLLEKSRCRGN